MNIIEFEEQRIKLFQKLNQNVNDRIKLFLLIDYFSCILSTKNKSIIEAFTADLIEIFISLLNKVNPLFLHPKNFQNVIDNSNLILEHISFEDISKMLKIAIDEFTKKFVSLEITLEGNVIESKANLLNFPVLEKYENLNLLNGGFVETITISINNTNTENKFIVVPSNSNIEKGLLEQINLSWDCAVNYINKIVKIKSHYHEVVVQFDQKAGNYIGNSFGTALTILFIQKLIEIYNSKYLIKIKPGIVITGGIDKNNEILSVGNDIIEKKTELVFYSTEQIFVVPKIDEIASLVKLRELHKEFPKRKLAIVAVENLDDLFNRRNIIEFKKLSLIKKTERKLKRNWKAAVIILPLLFALTLFLYRDWDDYPAILESSETTLFVKNKSGRVLWERKIGYIPGHSKFENYFSYFQKLVDINGDGVNEIIIANEELSELNNNLDFRRIVCFDKNKIEIWHYQFTDSISTSFDKMDTKYSALIIDTLSILNRKVLLCFSNNVNSFSSALFLLDLKTGKRVNSTLWNSGFFTNGIVNDFDNDGKKEIIATFINNGFEQTGILQIEVGKLNGQCPTTEKYKYKNLPLADLEQYILFPKTDYAHYFNQRIEGIQIGALAYREQNKLSIGIIPNNFVRSQYMYFYNFHNINFNIVIGNEFRVLRDSLVVKGKLKPPFTDTDEYCNLLISQIKYWNGKEFVYKNELD